MVVLSLARGGLAGTNDPYRVLVLLGPDDEHDATADWPDSDEPLLVTRVGFVEQLQVVHPRKEERTSLLEGDPVLGLVGCVLPFIPGESHDPSISQWRSPSMADLNTLGDDREASWGSQGMPPNE